MSERREIRIWHDAFGEPRDAQVLAAIERMEARGWVLKERREAGPRLWSMYWRGRTILVFERGA